MTRLDELDRDEWRDVVRVLKPALSDTDFDKLWRGFVDMKKAKALS